jgi:hypothetical protein
MIVLHNIYHYDQSNYSRELNQGLLILSLILSPDVTCIVCAVDHVFLFQERHATQPSREGMKCVLCNLVHDCIRRIYRRRRYVQNTKE